MKTKPALWEARSLVGESRLVLVKNDEVIDVDPIRYGTLTVARQRARENNRLIREQAREEATNG